jgi:5-methyltetrahydropteroyltriglutamate--homocysteine methyltransferase
VTDAYRADQVGSLLRPERLMQARQERAHGRLSAEELRTLEDEAILEALGHQRRAGVDVYVDGEFRRTGWMTGFADAVEGFVPAGRAMLPWKGGTGAEGESPNVRLATTKITPKARIAEQEARFLKDHAPGPFKITLPSPVSFVLHGWRRGYTAEAYPDPKKLLADTAAIIASEAERLSAEGVPYLQIDAPMYTHWIDETMRAEYEGHGLALDPLLDDAIAGDNAILDAAGDGIVTAVHLCRGNSMGRWLAEGGYDAIAEKLFTQLRCDRLLLEYDSPRAGGFEPLRFVAGDKFVVLGLLTTKNGRLESRGDLLRRIEEASAHVPVERLALSPQCGFASSGRGNPLTEEEQWRKLELVGSVADEVWGDT